MKASMTVIGLILACGLVLAAQPAAVTAPARTLVVSGPQSLVRPGEQVLGKTVPPNYTDEETLHVDGDNYQGIGFNGPEVWFSAVRLTTTRACTLTAVIFYRVDAALDDYLFVYGAGTTSEPGAVVESVPYTGSTSNDWERVDLPVSVPLDSGVDFWCGPRINQDAAGYPLGSDAGPAVATRGDWIYFEGLWEELSGLGLDYNWNIRAILGTGGGISDDVGMRTVLAPTGAVVPMPIAPRGLIYNYGANAEDSILVTCWIDSAGTHVYSETLTYIGPLNSSSADTVTFAPAWTGANGNSYTVRMFTSLAGDQTPANDTAHGTVTVSSATWQAIAAPADSADRLCHATVYDAHNDRIYMIGGNAAGNTGTYQTSCQEYNPVANSWTWKAPMPTARGWISGACAAGRIYIIGGHDNAGAADAVNECYDPAGDSWFTAAPRPTALLADMEAVWRDSLIYAMGGNNLSAGVTNVDVYNAYTNTWSTGTALPLSTFMGSATIIGDTIYVAQGYSGTSCWPNLYKGAINPSSPTSITWITGPTLSEPLFNGGTAALDGVVYWLGGFANAATVTNHVWQYSTLTGTITAFSPNYPSTLARCNYMVARPPAHELYVMAGDAAGNWTTPNNLYYKVALGPAAVEEGKVAVGGAIDNVAPTLVRNFSRISYNLSRRSTVHLGVYDATGALVRTLASGTFNAGSQSATWDRTNASGKRVANGTYFYRLTVNGKSVSAKAVVLN